MFRVIVLCNTARRRAWLARRVTPSSSHSFGLVAASSEARFSSQEPASFFASIASASPDRGFNRDIRVSVIRDVLRCSSLLVQTICAEELI